MNGKIASKLRQQKQWVDSVAHQMSVYLFSLSVIFSLASSRVFHLVFYKPRLNRIRDLRQTNPIDANCVRVITWAGSNEASDLKKSK